MIYNIIYCIILYTILCNIIYYLQCSSNQVLAEMFPDGDKHVTEVTKRPESAGTHFKNSIIALVDNLATKVLSLGLLYTAFY